MKVHLPCPYHNVHSNERRGKFRSEVKNATIKQEISFIYLHQCEGKFHHEYGVELHGLAGLADLVLVPRFVRTAKAYPD